MANTNFNQSSIFSGITWGTGSRSFLPAAQGSDLWTIAWAHDGHLYSTWGDGGGFTGTNTLGREQWGLARIEGASYAARSCYNVYGGNSAESPEAPVDPSTPASGASWKIGALWCANSILYAIQGDNSWWSTNSFIRWRIIKSTNAGSQWRMVNGASLDQGTWTCNSTACIDTWGPYLFQIGQNNALTPSSGYVFGCYVRSVNNYAIRAPLSTIGSKDTYEYHTGSNWSTNFANAEKKFEFNFQGDPRMFYLAPYSRYFMTLGTSDGTANWALLDAPDPWGPWTKVGMWTTWIDGTYKFGHVIPEKWVTSGNNEVGLIFSGVSSYDNFCSVKGTFSLYSAPGSGGSDPGSYSTSSWSTYTGSQSWVREIDGADLADGSASFTKFFDQLIAGQIAAGAIGAEEIAADTIAVKHLVVADYSNIIMNPMFSSRSSNDYPDKWYLTGGGANVRSAGYTGVPSGPPAPWIGELSTGAGPYFATSPFPVQSGEAYNLSFLGATDVNANSGNGGFTGWFLIKYNGNSYGYPAGIVASSAGGSPWTRYTTTCVMSGDIAMVSAVIMKGSELGKAFFAKPAVRRASGGDLIVDGSITAAKVGANEIVAETANIKNAIIGTLKMATDSITVANAAYLNWSSGFYTVNSGQNGKPLFVNFTSSGGYTALVLAQVGLYLDALSNIQVLRNGSNIMSIPCPGGHTGESIHGMCTDTTVTGANTYCISIDCLQNTFEGHRFFLSILELKR